jgi:hypothetical protein
MSRALRRTIALGCGVCLAVLTAAGLVYALRVAWAQRLYHEAKYGAACADIRQTLRLCEAAHRLYPHNYLFCLWTAERAYTAALATADAASSVRLMNAARDWCAMGLAINRYNGPLHLLQARLLERTSPAQAAACWAPYVEWQFWEPYNHAVLADFYAKAGEIEKAAEELEWTKGSPHYDWASQALRAAWQRERRFTPPPAASGRPPARPER